MAYLDDGFVMIKMAALQPKTTPAHSTPRNTFKSIKNYFNQQQSF